MKTVECKPSPLGRTNRSLQEVGVSGSTRIGSTPEALTMVLSRVVAREVLWRVRVLLA